jgi:hypothetical protein
MSPRWSGPLNDRRISRLTSRTKTKGTLREQQPGHARPSTVTRLQSISRGCRIFVPGASLACPPILLRRSMVRRGSTVRVRQRALQKPRKSGVSLSDLLARNPVQCVWSRFMELSGSERPPRTARCRNTAPLGTRIDPRRFPARVDDPELWRPRAPVNAPAPPVLRAWFGTLGRGVALGRQRGADTPPTRPPPAPRARASRCEFPIRSAWPAH